MGPMPPSGIDFLEVPRSFPPEGDVLFADSCFTLQQRGDKHL